MKELGKNPEIIYNNKNREGVSSCEKYSDKVSTGQEPTRIERKRQAREKGYLQQPYSNKYSEKFLKEVKRKDHP